MVHHPALSAPIVSDAAPHFGVPHDAPRPELEAFEREHAVISTRLMAGRTIAHVYADASPGAGFEPIEADLEDVYFSVMSGHHARDVTQGTGSTFAGSRQPPM